MAATTAVQQAAADSFESSKRIERQLKIAQQQATAAQDSVKTIQREMELDQRPWIKVEIGKSADSESKSFLVKLGGPLEIPFRMTNTGKTPAKQVKAAVLIDIVPAGQEPKLITQVRGPMGEGIPIPENTPKPMGKEELIAASGTIAARILPGQLADGRASRMEIVSGKSRKKLLSVPEANDLQGKNTYLVVHGLVRYADGFGVKHWATFCTDFFIDGLSADSRKCANYADDDNNWRAYPSSQPN